MIHSLDNLWSILTFVTLCNLNHAPDECFTCSPMLSRIQISVQSRLLHIYFSVMGIHKMDITGQIRISLVTKFVNDTRPVGPNMKYSPKVVEVENLGSKLVLQPSIITKVLYYQNLFMQMEKYCRNLYC